MNLLKTALVSLVLFSGVANAGSDLARYDCVFKAYGNKSEKSWVPSRLILSFEEAAGTATAYDDFIYYKFQKPVRVEMHRESEAKFRFTWPLTGLPMAANKSINARFTVRLNTARNTATIVVDIFGYDGTSRGEGTCKST